MDVTSYSDLCDLFAKMSDRRVRQAAPHILAKGRIDVMADYLVKAIRSESDAIYGWALDLLLRFVPPLCVEECIRLLQSAKVDVRWTACKVLEASADPWCERFLLLHLANEPDGGVQYQVVSALVECGTPDCLEQGV